MRSRRIHRLSSPITALKIIAFVSLYLAGLSLLPSPAAAVRALDGAKQMVVAQLADARPQDPVR